MATLHLQDLVRWYGSHRAVDGLTLTVADGEFVTLLGPSGCGKTTTLRMVAGFVAPSAGRILLDDQLLSTADARRNVPPERRGMGMVFQSYAVWPHLNAFENVAYPLRKARRDREEIVSRTREVLRLVHLDGLERRLPSELSGGQQQRVALARALIMKPSVLLLDEPLSNLDAKLREEMRVEIKELQERLGITVLYVTHDQEEAMTMSERVAVLRDGRLVQVADPITLYERPADPFVASFVGAANFLPGDAATTDGGDAIVRLHGAGGAAFAHPGAASGAVTVCTRPEWITIDGGGELRGEVRRATYLGRHVDCIVAVGDHALRVTTPADQRPRRGDRVRLTIRRAVLFPGYPVLA